MSIIPNNEMILESGRALRLKGIVMWYNSHYVTLFERDGIWYLYNDLFDVREENDYIKPIGSYSDLMSFTIEEANPIASVAKNAVFYWYI